jgi:hypothetical protein
MLVSFSDIETKICVSPQGTETARTANTDRPFSEILMSDKATMLFNALYCDSHRWVEHYEIVATGLCRKY